MNKVKLYYPNNKSYIDDFLFKSIDKESIDTLIVIKEEDKSTIGIDKIREVIVFLQQRPYKNSKKYVIIKNAQLLTEQAQNAFLKTLEEVPDYAEIRLGTTTIKDLLDTVISRCTKININGIENKSRVGDNSKKQGLEKYDFIDFYNYSTTQKLELIEQIGKLEKVIVIEVLEKWIAEAREELLKIQEKDLLKKDDIHKFLIKLTDLLVDYKKYNLSTKFILEYLVITTQNN